MVLGCMRIGLSSYIKGSSQIGPKMEGSRKRKAGMLFADRKGSTKGCAKLVASGLPLGGGAKHAKELPLFFIKSLVEWNNLTLKYVHM